MKSVIILGAGGHAKVVADILQLGGHHILGFLDDDAQLWGTSCLGLPVLGAIADYKNYQPDGLVLAIGSNAVRQTLAHRLGDPARDLWANAIHPRATIADSAQTGRGVVIAAHAVVNPDSVIGDHAIINTGATVDHDCRIGDFAHLAPGSHLAGAVAIGTGAFLGISTSVVPGVAVGEWATVGAGAVVLRDIPARATAFGVPAKVVQTKREI